MATKQDRGTKRTCQNGDCGARFYDLNRDPILCPVCGAKYVIASSPTAIAAVAAEKAQPRKPKKEEFQPVEAADEAVAGDEELADVETDETVADDEDETFLEEEEEDGGDMANIIGGPVAEGEEP